MSKAVVLTGFGAPDVLAWQEVTAPTPGDGEILLRVRAAGVGPTDLHIRHGDLAAVFPQRAGSVLGFEAAGEVAALGAGVRGVAVGDAVAALLPAQGGYADYVTTPVWQAKPDAVGWADAAALPASAEAALGVLRQVEVASGETVVVLGAAGSVGLIAVQLAVRSGARVIGAVAGRDAALIRELGAEPVTYGDGVFDRIAALAPRVHAVLDVAGRGGLPDAVRATGDAHRVITLADPSGPAIGVRLSNPTPERAPDALAVTMPLLATGDLRLKPQVSYPMPEAAKAHQELENGLRDKVVLTAPGPE
jgi:NADPH:quinone reductase-like Zn-dependent oxidoreductase